MIHFINKKALKSAKNKQKPILIDLSSCQECNHIILAFAQHLHGSDSVTLQNGRSLDALHDVMSDFFIEHWLNWRDIHIYGWEAISVKFPIFTQKILLTLINAYLTSIECELNNHNTSDEIAQSLTTLKPRIYILLS